MIHVLFRSLLAAHNDYMFVQLESGKTPKRGFVANLRDQLNADAKFVEELRQQGMVRIFVRGSNLDQSQALIDETTSLLQEYDISIPVEAVEIQVDQRRKRSLKEAIEGREPAPLPVKKKGAARLAGGFAIKVLTQPFTLCGDIITGTCKLFYPDPFFLPRAFWNSLARPQKAEVVGGLISKSYPFLASATQFVYTEWENPVAMGMLITSSFVVDAYFGIFAQSFSNFMHRLAQVGTGPQTAYLFMQNQAIGMWFRGIASGLGSAEEGPLDINYLGPSFLAALLGAYPGAAGYQGLNRLFYAGHISYGKRAAIIQYVRDPIYMIEQTQLYLGNWSVFYGLWTLNQSQNLYLYARSQLSAQKPMIMVIDPEIAENEEFWDLVPNAFANEPIAEPEMRQVVDGAINRFSRVLRGTNLAIIGMECAVVDASKWVWKQTVSRCLALFKSES